MKYCTIPIGGEALVESNKWSYLDLSSKMISNDVIGRNACPPAYEQS